MNDLLKPLLENNLLTDEKKEEIQEAIESELTNIREEAEISLRKEFAERYEHDKSILLDAVEKMVEDGLKAEIAEFVNDRKALAEQRVRLANEIREARITAKTKLAEQTRIIEQFVLNQLKVELIEFKEDKNQVREAKKELAKQTRENRVAYKEELTKNIGIMEQFVLNQLRKELTEFQEDKQALVKQRVKMIETGKAKIKQTQKEFVHRSANLLEGTITNILTKELSQLKEDIKVSKKKSFGMQLFEAFAAEYQTSFFNENAEVRNLKSKVNIADTKLTEAKSLFNQSQEIARKSQKRQMLAEGRAERAIVMNELLSKLSGSQREVMADLLEGVKTNNLRQAFKNYIPAVTNGSGNTVLTRKTASNKTLTENVKSVVTGNKTTKLTEGLENNKEAEALATAEIVDLRRLAGIQ